MIPERIRYLLGSGERVRVLDALDGGPMRQCDVSRRCSIPQSTVHRNLEGLGEWGWVEETDDGYALTVAGRRILAAYEAFVAEVEEVAEHEAFLRCCGRFDPAVPTSALSAGETTTSTEANPHAAAMEMASLIRRNAGDDVRVATGAVSPITNRAGWDAVEAGSHVESILGEDAFAAFREEYADTMTEAAAADGVDVRVARESFEFGLAVCGTEVGVSVPDATDGVEVCHVSAHPELRSWADSLYDRLRAGATPAADLVDAPAEAD